MESQKPHKVAPDDWTLVTFVVYNRVKFYLEHIAEFKQSSR